MNTRLTFYLLWIVFVLISSCVNTKSQSVPFPENIVDLAIANSDNNEIEVTGLYDSLVAVLPEDESTKLGAILKAKGFKLTNYGQGNWNKGPRYVERTYEKDSCICTVSKMYYTATHDSLFEIHESISCKDLVK
jgi:hypothetical protein